MRDRHDIIKQRLQNAFSPTHLEVHDDSEQHKGHAGSQGGAGHYTVIIAAECFKDKSRIAVHREIYHLLDDMVPDQIHALKIKARGLL
jgi:BolA protein